MDMRWSYTAWAQKGSRVDMSKYPGIELKVIEEQCLAALPEGVIRQQKGAWIALTTALGNKGPRIYIASASPVCRQVDLSGFGKGLPGTERWTQADVDAGQCSATRLGEPKLRSLNGAVEAHLDMADQATAVEALRAMIAMLPTAEPTKRERKTPLGGGQKLGDVKKDDAAAAMKRVHSKSIDPSTVTVDADGHITVAQPTA